MRKPTKRNTTKRHMMELTKVRTTKVRTTKTTIMRPIMELTTMKTTTMTPTTNSPTVSPPTSMSTTMRHLQPSRCIATRQPRKARQESASARRQTYQNIPARDKEQADSSTASSSQGHWNGLQVQSELAPAVLSEGGGSTKKHTVIGLTLWKSPQPLIPPQSRNPQLVAPLADVPVCVDM
ncbi:hypothetical protein CNYM01_12600 [Colletotrichum nymphaeae SA-01]|uniref:Uncharacterized protein n=1 Tax=Colletotrichum nymphaeae SA-01 TaxID=1460502 RepID=A0A135SYI0_9PEZI|nr:hypothetical protein CNYM01_12600 [Colletotrichum nymphaeae SA-01]